MRVNLIALVFALVAGWLAFHSRYSYGADSLIVMGHSYHFNRRIHHNETNYGLGYQHGIGDNTSVAFGYYQNSYYRATWYGLYIRKPWAIGQTRVGYVLGAVTGYSKGPSPFLSGIASFPCSKTVHFDLIFNSAAIAAAFAVQLN